MSNPLEFIHDGGKYCITRNSLRHLLDSLRSTFGEAQDDVPYGTRAQQKTADFRSERFANLLAWLLVVIDHLDIQE